MFYNYLKIMRTFHLLILLLIFGTVNAQKMLTLEDAVNIALKNNYDILVARNDADIAKANNTAGNAGMLPTLEVIGSGSAGLSNVSQKLSTGNINNYPLLSSTSINAGTELSWSLFDGGKMFITKSKLNEIQSLGKIQFKERVLQTQFEIIATYYDVVKQKQQLKSINEVISFNRERVKITETGFNAGYFLKSDLLQSKIDLNVAMSNAINQQYAIDAAKKLLNNLLGQKADSDFEVSDSIPLNYSPNKDELVQKLNSSNTSILTYQKQIDIATLALKENKTNYLPTINLNGGYYFSQNTNSAGSTLQNSSFGPQIGGNITIPLYSAGENKRKVTTAKLDLQSAEYNLQNVSLQAHTDLDNAFSDFENQKQLLKIEEENNQLTKENLEISLQRLRLGQTTSLEVHQAQEFYIQSFTRLTNIRYNLKIAESKLKQLIASF